MKAAQKSGAKADILLLDGMGEDSAPDALASALAELEDSGGGGVVRVERLRDGKRPEFCGEIDVRGFSLLAVQERFGGGEFLLRVLNAKRQYRTQTTVAIAQPLKAPEAPGALDKIATLLSEQQKILSLLVAHGLGGNPGAGQTRAQVLEELKTMREILGGGASPVGPEKILEVLRSGIELARETQGGEGDGMYGVIAKAIEVLGPQIGRVLDAAAHSAPGPASPELARPPALAAAQPERALPVNSPLGAKRDRQLRLYIAFLLQAAALGETPENFVGLVLDSVPEEVIREFLTEGDPVEKLAAFDARVRDKAEWFRALGVLLQEELPNAPGPGGAPAADGAAADDS
jgi:hypothetical protein